MEIPIKVKGEEDPSTGSGQGNGGWRPSQSFETFGRIRRLHTEQTRIDADPAVSEQGSGASGDLGAEYGRGEDILNWVIKGAIYCALFLTPLFYFFSSDTLGFAKSSLLVVLALIALAAWIVKAIIAGKFTWHPTRLSWTVVALAAVALLASLFSSSVWVSVLGDAGRYAHSASTLFAGFVLFAVVLGNFEKKDAFRAALVVLAANAVSMLLAFAQFTGIHILPGEFARNEVFNTVGSLFALSLWAALAIPLIIELLQTAKKRWHLIVLAVLGILNLGVLLAVNFRTAWVALSLGLLIYIGLYAMRHGITGQRRLILPLLVLVISVLMWILPNSPTIAVVQVPVEVAPSHRASLSVMRGAWSDNFLLGTGPETFPYAYGRYKSADINQTNFWGLNFTDASSEVIAWASNMGLLGILAFLAFAGGFVVYALRYLRTEGGIASGIFASWALLLVAHFLYPASIVLAFMFWLLPALFIVYTRGMGEYVFKPKSTSTLLIFVGSVLVLVLAIGGLYLSIERWRAEAAYAHAASGEVNRDNIDARIDDAARAVAHDPREARYYRTLAQLLIGKVQIKIADINARPAAQRTATPEEAREIQSLTAQALVSIQRAQELDPENVSLLIAAGEIYSVVSGYVDQALERAIATFEKAVTFEPVNPFLHTQLAQLYLAKGNFFRDPTVRTTEEVTRARAELEKALELNPNYSNARYFLGLIMDRQGDRAGALEQFERIAQFNPDNQVVQLILGNLRAGRPALSPPVPVGAEAPPVEDQGIPEE